MTGPTGDDRIETSVDPSTVSALTAAHNVLAGKLFAGMGTAFAQQSNGFSPQRAQEQGWTDATQESDRRWQQLGTVAQHSDELLPLPWENPAAKATASAALSTGLDRGLASWQDNTGALAADTGPGPDDSDHLGTQPDWGDTFIPPADPPAPATGDPATGGSSTWSTALGGFFTVDEGVGPADQDSPRASFAGATFTPTDGGNFTARNPFR
jgi:hypothetical protein